MRIICLSLVLIFVTPTTLLANMLACRGEDPFWTLDLDIEDSSALFERIGDPQEKADIALTAFAQGNSAIRAFSLLNTQTGFSGIALAAPDECKIKDDDSYSHRLEFLTQFQSEAILLTGCCRAQQTE